MIANTLPAPDTACADVDCTSVFGSTFGAAAVDEVPTPPVGSSASGASVGGAAIGLSAAIAPTPGKIRTNAAGAWTIALVGPVVPLTAAPDGAI